MDHRHFDALTRSLTTGNSRRRLLGLLVTAPVAGGLLRLSDSEEAEAGGRRRRRVKRHKHGASRRRTKRRDKRKRPPVTPTCTPESTAQTCARTCGTVMNNCETPVNCGSCVCEPTCAVCLTCDDTTGNCVPDPDQQGDPCGQLGQVCRADGTCGCTESSCPVCRSCQENGECTTVCDGCCDGVTCHLGNTPEACGEGGVTCEACATGELCSAGACDWAEGYEEINGGEFRICNRFICSTGCICTGNLGVNYVCANSASAPCTGHADCPAGQGCRWGTCYESC